METEEQSRRDCERAFQSSGAMAVKDRPHKVDSLVRGTMRRLEVEDLRDQGGEYRVTGVCRDMLKPGYGGL